MSEPTPFLATIAPGRLEFLLIYLAGLGRDFKKLTGSEHEQAAGRMGTFLDDVILPRASSWGQWLTDGHGAELDDDDRALLLAMSEAVTALRRLAEPPPPPPSSLAAATWPHFYATTASWHPAAVQAHERLAYTGPAGDVFRMAGCQLTEEEVIALILDALEGYSLRDIATLTSVSYGTVKRRLDSAQATYRKALERPELEVSWQPFRAEAAMTSVVRLSTEWLVHRKRGLLSWAEWEMRKHGAVVEDTSKKTQARVGEGPQRDDGRDSASDLGRGDRTPRQLRERPQGEERADPQAEAPQWPRRGEVAVPTRGRMSPCNTAPNRVRKQPKRSQP